MSKRILVLAGGIGVEREVSFMSAERVVTALKNLNFTVDMVDVDSELPLKLHQAKPDVVFNALHGSWGENGAIPGLLDVMNIPYTGCGVLASAIGMNKVVTADILEKRGVKVPKRKLVDVETIVAAQRAGKHIFEGSYVIKPIAEGSSVGVTIVKEGKPLNFSVDEWKFGSQALVEEFIPGKELSCGFFKDRAVGMVEIQHAEEFLDYGAKYSDGGSRHVIPDLPSAIHQKILKITEIAHRTLGCRTISRSDFRYNEELGEDGVYFLEINTHPGLTKYSILPDIVINAGYTFEDILLALIEDAKYGLQ